MPQRRITLPASPDSPLRARRQLRAWLADADADGTADSDAAHSVLDEDIAADAVLLASELCDNAVLHAGTGFAMDLAITDTDLTVTVTDHGVQPLERYLSAPRPTTGRAATHGRGLLLIEKMSDAWGTRHDADGHHTWFALNRTQLAAAPGDPGPAPGQRFDLPPGPLDAAGVGWPPTHVSRRLLHLPPRFADELTLPEQVAELLRSLSEVTGVTGAAVSIDYDDGRGDRVIATVGADPGHDTATAETPIPLTPPLRGRLTAIPGPLTGRDLLELLELCAQRVALSVESAWLSGVDHRQRAWMTYLTDASELLSQPRELELTAAIVPQIVVPRLGPWCVVHIYDSAGHLQIGALTHADEDRIDQLRAVMSGPLVQELNSLAPLLTDPTQLTLGPLPMVAVPLISHGQVRGILSVSYPPGRPHTPEEIMVLRDLSRRASVAIDNAQHLAAHKTTSQTLQRALLPRAMPASAGIEFAAGYLPASAAAAVGGDFYGVLELDRDSQWLSFIGDVCGKGPAAAARTAVVREVLTVLIRDGRPSIQALEGVNRALLEARDPYQFCTLAAALISRPDPGEPPGLDVVLILAGHEPLVLLRADGHAELVGTPGTALGIVPTLDLTPQALHLRPGDTLIAYTDGVVEQRRKAPTGQQEQFGHDRLLTTASEAANLGAKQIITRIRDTMTDFGPEPQHDDIALLVVQAITEEPTHETRRHHTADQPMAVAH